MKNQEFTEPEGIGISAFSANQKEQNLFINAHEVIFDIKLEIPGTAAAVGSDLADKSAEAVHALVNPLAFTAGIRVMDENRLPDSFQIIHQDMVNNAVTKICCKNFPEFGFFAEKADRTAGAISAVSQFPAKFEQFLFLIHLESQSVYGIPFVFPTEKILPVHIFKRKKQEKTLSAANG